jgi:GPH family glycoside/pentoside/hexuronide:cation symporter
MARVYNFERLGAKVFDSKVKSSGVKNSERWLGYFLGPALVACVHAACGTNFLNIFFTDVLKMSSIAGGAFLALMPVISKILDAITNIAMGRMVDNTHSARGKARPWILVSGPLLTLSAILLYLAPTSDITMQVLWVTMTYNLYHCVAYTMFNISYVLMVPLSTRNNKQRDTLAMAQSMGYNLVPGMVAAMIYPMVILPMMGIDQNKWIIVMSITAFLAIPATLLQYFFTRERVTEETQNAATGTATRTLREQIKGCLSSRYWIIIIGVTIVYWVYNNIQITGILYYCNWVLGTYNDGTTMALFNVIGQTPLGFGILALWPLTKKFGKRNVMIIGSIIGAAGNLICMLNPANFMIVMAGVFIRSIGTLPITYLLFAMLADALDHVEWVNKFRCDGFSSSVYSIVFTVSAGLGLGIFNLFLGLTGYVPPAADGTLVVQNAAVQNFFAWAVFGIPAIGSVMIGTLIYFFRIEKELPIIRADIINRHKAEAASRGEVYVSPEEKAQMEQKQIEAETEVKRVAELKALCAKKGLDFDKENAKYLEKEARKASKAAAKKK